jgi:diguanylate cyclase (GGDEF)-like protein/PAS domain S-box-containing protein
MSVERFAVLGSREVAPPLLSRVRNLQVILLLLCGFSLPAQGDSDAVELPTIDLALTAAEKAWIKSHPTVFFTGDPNWLPYEAFKNDGTYIGIVADHLELIAHYTGIVFEPVAVSTWSESLDVARQGKVEVVSGDAADAILNRQFNPVDAYSQNPIVIIMDVNQNYVEDLRQIKHRKIAIIKDYGYTADIYRLYPDFSFIEVENIQEGLQGVSEKRYHAMLSTMALASYHMAEMGLRGIKVVGKTPIIMDLTLFVDKSHPMLHGIINKTLKALPPSAKQSILQKWITREYVEKTDYKLLAESLIVLSLIFAITTWWIYRLRREIHFRRKAEGLLRESEQRYDLAMAVANDGIWDWNIDEDKVLFDRRYYLMAGYQPYEFPQAFNEWEIRVHPEDLEDAKLKLESYLESLSEKYDVEFRFRRKVGGYMWIHARGKIVEWDEEDKPRRVVGTHSDITQKKVYESQLEHIAHFDSLTGLPNRVLLIDRLNQAMYQTLRREKILVIAYLDLDGFKAVNDENDHETGDKFLTAIATRMHEVLRKGDTLSRLGGDEFVAVLVDLPSTEEGLPLVSRLLEAAALPVAINNNFLRVSASIGVTFYPQANVVDAEQLIRQADHAMYQAKLRGKNRYQVFDLEQDSSVRNQQENLRAAIEAFNEGQYILHYQPKVNMHTGELVGLEALMRWRHPKMGLLTPAYFLSHMENTELEIAVGEWAFETVLKQLTLWCASGEFPTVSINVGSMHLQQADFVERLKYFLETYPTVPAKCIELEVLETNALDDIKRVSMIMEECGKIGVNFALDDFGTGYSSLSYLKQLPATTLKIDQNFVRDMLDDPEDLAILEGVIGIASAFNRKVVAEGVESEEQGELLLKLGCELAQGYQISRPLPAEKVEPWIKDWKPCRSWQSQKAYLREDYSILFAGVELRSWVKNVERFLYWETKDIPEPNHSACTFGKWLAEEGRKKFGDTQIYNSLWFLHRDIHEHAGKLIALHRKGNHGEAKAGIGKLIVMRDKLVGELNRLNLNRN